MKDMLTLLLDTSPFMPHGHCFLWDTALLWLYALSDTLIALAYFSLPAALIYFVHKRRDLAFKPLFIMFGAFILACGLTHVMDVWTLWIPAYWLGAAVRVVTAVISVTTAIMIWPLLPQALALPSPTQLQTVIHELQHEVAERMAVEQALRASEQAILQLNEDLEMKVQKRTRQLLEAQEELVRQGKLAVLGQVAGSVGHELRNPLGVINNAVYFLQTVLPDADDTIKEYLGIIQEEITASERIVSDLLDSVRTKPPHPEAVEIAQLLKQCLSKCGIPPAITVTLDIPKTLPPLRADPLQIYQVFRNLINNGVEAMPKGGALTIRAVANTAGKNVSISVCDTGLGIPPEQLNKLFQPLFTTKSRGVGLGLVVVKNLAQANGGNVAVASQPGKGSTFTITLPSDT